jgi:hypothetical protein
MIDLFADLEVEPCPEIPAPPVEEWLAALEVEPWLASAVREPAYSVPSRLARAGLLVRMASARELVREWMQEMSPEQVSFIQRVLIDIVSYQMGEFIDQSPSFTAGEVEYLCVTRDNFESVKRVLCLIGKGEIVTSLLAHFDMMVDDHLSALMNVMEPMEESHPMYERWHQVRWMEPNAWWPVL